MKVNNGNHKSWEITERQAGKVAVLRVSGHLEMGGGSDQLEEKLLELVGAGRRAVLLECRDVLSIDSSAVGALVRCFISLEKRGGKLKLLRISAVVRAALDFVGLIHKIEIFDDEAIALASFH